MTTQLFWTVLVGITSTGLAVIQLAIPLVQVDASKTDQSIIGKTIEAISVGLTDWNVGLVVQAVSVGLTIYQVLLLGQSVFRLYAATFWMPKA